MAEPDEKLSIEELDVDQPALAPGIKEHAREALAAHHTSPAPMLLRRNERVRRGSVEFSEPDPRVGRTYERQTIIEHGAIVIGGLLLARFEGKRITRVAPRGSRVDYFVGEVEGDERWLLEASGTDHGELEGLRRKKRAQLEGSFYRKPPFRRSGFVAVTRFAVDAASALDFVESE
jgi:hypothetical protein